MKQKIVLPLLIVFIFVNAIKTNAQFSDSVKTKIDNYVQLYAIKNESVFLTLITDAGGNVHYSGYDGRNNQPFIDFSLPFEIGSCSKMFTAAAIMQLIEINKISLNDRLVTVLPNPKLYKNLLVIDGNDYIDSVRIINLLNHSSGFPDYFVSTDSLEILVSGDATLKFTPEQLIRRAKRLNKPYFIPGTGQFKYSNVNYILLGMIIEKLTGMKYQQYIQSNIIEPLGMKQTYFGSVKRPEKEIQGHFQSKISEMPPTIAWSAGEIISTLDDMTVFIRSWYAGKIFIDKRTIEMLLNENFLSMGGMEIEYGLGTLTLGKKAWGHAGQTFGWQSFMGVMPNGYSFVFGIDDADSDGWVPAILMSRLLDAN